jgi:hypothetical protein
MAGYRAFGGGYEDWRQTWPDSIGLPPNRGGERRRETSVVSMRFSRSIEKFLNITRVEVGLVDILYG